MIVYVESNFVLELAFLQEEYESCLELLRLAESQDIRLVLPAFSIGEPYEVWVRRSKQRRELRDQLSTAIRELSRSRPYQASSHEFQELTNLLLRSGEEEKRRLDEALDRILRTAEVSPIGLNTIRSAITLQESRSLSPQDSTVYASILAHLAEASEGLRCFITKNSKDFVNPDIENDLATRTCRLLTKFGDGLGYVRSRRLCCDNTPTALAANRTRDIRRSGMRGGLAETWARVERGTRRTDRKSESRKLSTYGCARRIST